MSGDAVPSRGNGDRMRQPPAQGSRNPDHRCRDRGSRSSFFLLLGVFGLPARAPLVNASVSSRHLHDQRLCPGTEQMACMTSSMCVRDRRRCSEALGLADNSHRNRSMVIHRLPQHRRGVQSLRDCRHWRTQAPLDYRGPSLTPRARSTPAQEGKQLRCQTARTAA
jgi:hypothetical protein